MARNKITFVLLLAYLTLASTSSIRFTSELNNLSREQVTSVIRAFFPVVIVSNPWARSRENCSDTEYNNGTVCLDCKTWGDECTIDLQCCMDPFLICTDGTQNRLGCFCESGLEWLEEKCVQKTTHDNSTQFMMAAQIALGAALVVAVSALSALTCKMCSSRRQLEELQRRDSGASSLNSIQRFVISRLRDRPPRYDDVPDKPPSYVADTPSSSTRPPVPTAPRLSVVEARTLPPNPPDYEQVISELPSTSTADPSSLIPHPVASFPQVRSTAEELPEITTETLDASQNTEVLESISQNTENLIENNEISGEISGLNHTSGYHETSGLPEYIEIVVPNSVVYRNNNNDPNENGIDNPAFTSNECHM